MQEVRQPLRLMRIIKEMLIPQQLENGVVIEHIGIVIDVISRGLGENFNPLFLAIKECL